MTSVWGLTPRRPYEGSVATLKPLTGDGREFVNKVEVMFRGDNRDMPHIGSQRRQLRLHVLPVAVPSQKRVDREGVAIMPISA